MRGIFFVGCIAILLFAANCQQELHLVQTLKQANSANGQVLGDDLKLDDFVIQLHSHLFVEKRSSIPASELEKLSKDIYQRRLGSGKSLAEEKKELEDQKSKVNSNGGLTLQGYQSLASSNSFFQWQRLIRIRRAPNPTSTPILATQRVGGIPIRGRVRVPAPTPAKRIATTRAQRMALARARARARARAVPAPKPIRPRIRGRLLNRKTTNSKSTQVNRKTGKPLYKAPPKVQPKRVQSTNKVKSTKKVHSTKSDPKESYGRGHWFSLSSRPDGIRFPKRMDRAARDYSIKRVQASIEETRKMGVTVPEPNEFQKVIYNDENKDIIPASSFANVVVTLNPYKGASLAEYASMYERVSITHSINNPGLARVSIEAVSVERNKQNPNKYDLVSGFGWTYGSSIVTYRKENRQSCVYVPPPPPPEPKKEEGSSKSRILASVFTDRKRQRAIHQPVSHQSQTQDKAKSAMQSPIQVKSSFSSHTPTKVVDLRKSHSTTNLRHAQFKASKDKSSQGKSVFSSYIQTKKADRSKPKLSQDQTASRTQFLVSNNNNKKADDKKKEVAKDVQEPTSTKSSVLPTSERKTTTSYVPRFENSLSRASSRNKEGSSHRIHYSSKGSRLSRHISSAVKFNFEKKSSSEKKENSSKSIGSKIVSFIKEKVTNFVGNFHAKRASWSDWKGAAVKRLEMIREKRASKTRVYPDNSVLPIETDFIYDSNNQRENYLCHSDKVNVINGLSYRQEMAVIAGLRAIVLQNAAIKLHVESASTSHLGEAKKINFGDFNTYQKLTQVKNEDITKAVKALLGTYKATWTIINFINGTPIEVSIAQNGKNVPVLKITCTSNSSKQSLFDITVLSTQGTI